MSEQYVPGQQTPVVPAGDIYNALVASRGNISEAARLVGMTRSKTKERIDKDPVLLTLCDDLRQGIVDRAEQNVFKEVEKDDGASSRFVLQTLGRDRGYMTGVAGAGKDGEILVQINRLAPETAE